MAAPNAPSTTTDRGLVVAGIGVRFGGVVALDDVSFAVPEGAVAGLIGPNGAGKTTLFNVLCGFVRAGTGTVHWQGRAIRPRPHRLVRLGISRTLQGIGLFPALSALENVMAGVAAARPPGFTGSLLALPRADRAERDRRDRAHAALAELGIAGYADQRPEALPYPVRKKVALARALAARPRLLLLDEPAGGLGTDDLDELAELVTSLPARAGGCTVLLVEHHMDLVMRVCQRVVVLDFGRVIAAGPPERIRTDPAVAEAYLGTS